jgi:hypothetical protein
MFVIYLISSHSFVLLIETEVGAALGIVWAHNVNTRFALDYNANLAATPENQGIRILTIAKSPQFSFSKFEYKIDETGARILRKLDDVQQTASVLDLSLSTPKLPIGQISK